MFLREQLEGNGDQPIRNIDEKCNPWDECNGDWDGVWESDGFTILVNLIQNPADRDYEQRSGNKGKEGFDRTRVIEPYECWKDREHSESHCVK